MPHWTQRVGSGTTQAVARAAYFALSDSNKSKALTLPFF
jgi:hypothetical protein